MVAVVKVFPLCDCSRICGFDRSSSMFHLYLHAAKKGMIASFAQSHKKVDSDTSLLQYYLVHLICVMVIAATRES
jgi:hypothetical protein